MGCVQASTVACAGVTAWSSVDGLKNLSPEKDYALLEGKALLTSTANIPIMYHRFDQMLFQ